MLENKEIYETPILEIEKFSTRDILTTSIDPDNEVNLPIFFFD